MTQPVKDIQVLVDVDVDVDMGAMGGMFAGEAGSPRLLTLLDREQITSTCEYAADDFRSRFPFPG